MLRVLIVSVIVSAVLTYFVRFLAGRFGVVDIPDGARHRHTKPVALLGGVGIMVAFFAMVGYLVGSEHLLDGRLTMSQLISVFVASIVIVVLGVCDDIFNLSPRLRFGITLLAAFIPLAGGIGLDGVTNPFGGILPLDKPSVTLPILERVLVIGDVLVFLWLLGIMYTTKILDGLDGLATGIAAIGGLMVFGLTQTTKFYQPDVGYLALAFSGVCIGFLVFNFKPASIFLGESGSLFLGFILGILGVISGGKIATTLLVMGVPILDLARVVVVRLVRGQSIMQGDREHLHFRLLDLGLSERGTVLLLYAVAAGFGITTLFLQSRGKLLMLFVLFVAMIIIGIGLYKTPQRA